MLQFGAFELAVESRELRKRGLRIKISPQAFSVLLCLVEHRGQLVSREELRDRLWPEKVHVEFDGSLNAVVRDVRDALGDSARNPRYIETEPKLGYRFIAPVQVIPVPVSKPPLPEVEEPAMPVSIPRAGPVIPPPSNVAAPVTARSWAIPVRPLMTVAVVLLAIAALGSWWRSQARNQPRDPLITQYSYYLGKVGHPTFSPDGKRIAFHWNPQTGGSFDIYTKGLDSDELVRLTEDAADDLYPVWSPNGREVVFGRRLENGRMALMLVPSRGGPARRLAELGNEGPFTWSPDGRVVVYSVSFPNTMPPTSGQGGIWMVSPETGERTQIIPPDRKSLGDSCPIFSPEGRRLAFVRVFSSGITDLQVVGLDNNLHPVSAPRRLTFDEQFIRDPVWSPDGRFIIFSSQRGGRLSLWKVAVTGSRTEPVELGGENAIEPAFHPSGRKLLFSRISTVDTMRRLAMNRGSEVEITSLLYARKEVTNPSYSPDGKRIAFESSRCAYSEIWLCDRDGSNQRELTHLRSPVTGTPKWSPDGRFIVFDARQRGRGDIFIVPAEGGDPRRITSGTGESIVPYWSRDGQWIYFGSDRSGEFQIWKMHPDGSGVAQVTRQGGFFAVESMDGSTLYYSKSTRNGELWKVPASGGAEVRVADQLSTWENFAVGEKGLYMIPTWTGRKIPIQFLPFHGGERTLMATVSGVGVQGISVAPDNQALLMSLRESEESDLMQMELPE